MLDLVLVRAIFILVLAAAAFYLHPSESPWISVLGGAALGGCIILFEMRLERVSLKRLIGAAVGSVLGIVGAFLMWLDIRPEDIFRGIIQLVDRIWSLGFDAIREIAKYILAGAAIVVPVWLVLRLMNMRNAR